MAMSQLCVNQPGLGLMTTLEDTYSFRRWLFRHLGPFKFSELPRVQDLQAGRPVGTSVSGWDAASRGPYRMSLLFAPDVPKVVAAVFAAGAPPAASPAPRRRTLRLNAHCGGAARRRQGRRPTGRYAGCGARGGGGGGCTAQRGLGPCPASESLSL